MKIPCLYSCLHSFLLVSLHSCLLAFKHLYHCGMHSCTHKCMNPCTHNTASQWSSVRFVRIRGGGTAKLDAVEFRLAVAHLWAGLDGHEVFALHPLPKRGFTHAQVFARFLAAQERATVLHLPFFLLLPALLTLTTAVDEIIGKGYEVFFTRLHRERCTLVAHKRNKLIIFHSGSVFNVIDVGWIWLVVWNSRCSATPILYYFHKEYSLHFSGKPMSFKTTNLGDLSNRVSKLFLNELSGLIICCKYKITDK